MFAVPLALIVLIILITLLLRYAITWETSVYSKMSGGEHVNSFSTLKEILSALQSEATGDGKDAMVNELRTSVGVHSEKPRIGIMSHESKIGNYTLSEHRPSLLGDDLKSSAIV